MDRRQKQLESLLALPCIRQVGEYVEVRFVGVESFHRDVLLRNQEPVIPFIAAHERLKMKVQDLWRRKEAVLCEIKNGTYRYKIIGGDFELGGCNNGNV